MSQYCPFSRIFLGKMFPATNPLSWLSMFEAGQGWTKGRFTRSSKLFVALMSGGFQRTSFFCFPINLSSKWLESLILSLEPLSYKPSSHPPSVVTAQRDSCPELWDVISTLQAAAHHICFYCRVRLVLRDYKHHPHLRISVYRHWRHSPGVNCLMQWVTDTTRTGRGKLFLSGCLALAQQQPALLCSVLLPASQENKGFRSRFACWLVSFQPWATALPHPD